MTYIISEPCIDIKDRSCVDVCPVDCIHEFERMLIIDPEECIDCGACEPECPVEAIFPEDALPDKWEPFVKINYAFPQGAAVNPLVQAYAEEHTPERAAGVDRSASEICRSARSPSRLIPRLQAGLASRPQAGRSAAFRGCANRRSASRRQIAAADGGSVRRIVVTSPRASPRSVPLSSAARSARPSSTA